MKLQDIIKEQDTKGLVHVKNKKSGAEYNIHADNFDSKIHKLVSLNHSEKHPVVGKIDTSGGRKLLNHGGALYNIANDYNAKDAKHGDEVMFTPGKEKDDVVYRGKI